MTSCVYPVKKKPHYMAGRHSEPKKIVDIFNLKKPVNTPSQPKIRTPTYKWETTWGNLGTEPSNKILEPKQTKYQAFSIENYLKHLLKVQPTHLIIIYSPPTHLPPPTYLFAVFDL